MSLRATEKREAISSLTLWHLTAVLRLLRPDEDGTRNDS